MQVEEAHLDILESYCRDRLESQIADTAVRHNVTEASLKSMLSDIFDCLRYQAPIKGKCEYGDWECIKLVI